MFEIIQDYAGLLIGLVFLLLAVSVLPGRIKWYVLTAGLAILGYEAYMRTRNRKLMKEADAERKVLKQRVVKLDEHSVVLEKTVAELNKQSEQLQQKQFELDKKKSELEQRGGDIAAKKQALDIETEKLLEETDDVLQKLDGSESVLARLLNAKNSFNQIENANH